MKTFNPSTIIRALLLAVGLSLTLPAALAQNSAPAQGGATTETTRTTWVDPLWLILGGVALLAIILIVVLASRGRARDRVATHVERETVIKKD